MSTRHLSNQQRQRHTRFAAAPSPDELSGYFTMQKAIQQAKASGLNVRDDDLAHLSPLIWRHLNFLG